MTDELREMLTKVPHPWKFIVPPSRNCNELAVAAVNALPSLLTRLAELEEALRPFAEVGGYIERETIGYADDDRFMLTVKDAYGKHHGLTGIDYSAFLHARAALDGEG